jgi:hypothetical protein
VPSDNFGVHKLYTDSIKKPMSWLISTDQDYRMEIGGNLSGFTRVNDLFTFTTGNDKGRISVFTTTGYDETLINRDHSQCAANKYMMSRIDWRDIEATTYINMSSLEDDEFFISCRGGKHYGNNNCEGFGYIASVYYSGAVSFSKEQFHQRIIETDPIVATGSNDSVWLGIKFVCYNDLSGNVILELWLDVNNNNSFTCVNRFIDAGGWGDSGEHCGGTVDQIGIWGGPVVTFGWNNCSTMDIKAMSVREIDVYGTYNESGSNILESIGVGGTGRSGSGSRVDKSLKEVNLTNASN